MYRFFLSVGGLAFLGNKGFYEATPIVNCSSYLDLASSGIRKFPGGFCM